jgi:hypothetical protein
MAGLAFPWALHRSNKKLGLGPSYDGKRIYPDLGKQQGPCDLLSLPMMVPSRIGPAAGEEAPANVRFLERRDPLPITA